MLVLLKSKMYSIFFTKLYQIIGVSSKYKGPSGTDLWTIFVIYIKYYLIIYAVLLCIHDIHGMCLCKRFWSSIEVADIFLQIVHYRPIILYIIHALCH